MAGSNSSLPASLGALRDELPLNGLPGAIDVNTGARTSGDAWCWLPLPAAPPAAAATAFPTTPPHRTPIPCILSVQAIRCSAATSYSSCRQVEHNSSPAALSADVCRPWLVALPPGVARPSDCFDLLFVLPAGRFCHAVCRQRAGQERKGAPSACCGGQALLVAWPTCSLSLACTPLRRLPLLRQAMAGHTRGGGGDRGLGSDDRAAGSKHACLAFPCLCRTSFC